MRDRIPWAKYGCAELDERRPSEYRGLAHMRPVGVAAGAVPSRTNVICESCVAHEVDVRERPYCAGCPKALLVTGETETT